MDPNNDKQPLRVCALLGPHFWHLLRTYRDQRPIFAHPDSAALLFHFWVEDFYYPLICVRLTSPSDSIGLGLQVSLYLNHGRRRRAITVAKGDAGIGMCALLHPTNILTHAENTSDRHSRAHGSHSTPAPLPSPHILLLPSHPSRARRHYQVIRRHCATSLILPTS